MAAITGTLAHSGELAGDTRLLHLTATLESASDVITLTAAAHGGVTSIVGVVGSAITGGIDAAFMEIQVSYDGLEITVVSLGEGGLDATDWTGATIALTLLIKTTA
jgi:hypothetical protein